MLTDDFKVVDYQATASGYYLLRFRDKAGNDLTVEQTGKGGCNGYFPFTMRESFGAWLEDNINLFIGFWEGMARNPQADQYTKDMALDFADNIRSRGIEWQDHCCMTICDMIENRLIRVGG